MSRTSKRAAEDCTVVETGVQTFEHRFRKKRRFDDDTPRISPWRTNLSLAATARLQNSAADSPSTLQLPISYAHIQASGRLSQIHNLYFVAYRQDIFVYEPKFPSQAVSEKPCLIFSSQPSSPSLQGYIEPRTPHAINNLIVHLLGTEEVVAVVRDDGDVDAFLIRHVLHAISRRAATSSTIGAAADEVRPFFQANTGNSTWGLAIHAAARILAVSSNSHDVQVYKFGLLHASDEDDGESDTDRESDGKLRQHERENDVTHHILNGQANIPCIAFCNTGDDPDGRWLLTTDISGMCRVMDLRELKQSQAFRFGQSFTRHYDHGFDRLNAGWGIMFLDRRSFQSEHCITDALGLLPGEALPSLKTTPGLLDLTKTVDNLPGAAEPLVYHPPSVESISAQPAVPTSSNEPDDIDPDQSDSSARGVEINQTTGSDDGRDTQETSPRSDDLEGLDLSNEAGGIQNSNPGAEQTNQTQSTTTHQSSPTPPPSQSTDEPPASQITLQEAPVLLTDSDDPDSEMTEDSISHTTLYSGKSLCAHLPRFIHPVTVPMCADLPCLIIHTSPRNIYLLQPSNQKLKNGPFCPPMLGYANPLQQALQHDFGYLRNFERLNMTCTIPSLGIVIVASQKGRALVLQLTKLSQKAAGMAKITAATEASRTVYTMRAKCILPLAHQEEKNQRPFAPLHGIAVSPVQGSGAEGGKGKRWRLLMMYQDHSILSYAIQRSGEVGTRDSGVHVEGLVV